MKVPKKILERRRSIRIEEALAFKIGHESYETEATTVNISSHGAMCLVERDIPIMTRLRIGLTIPGGNSAMAKDKVVQAVGVVVRKERDAESGKFYIALYFSKVSPKDQKILDEFIQKHSRE